MTCPMNYVDPPDVPEGMTLAEYRRDRTRTAAPPRALKRLRRKAKARSAARRAAQHTKAA
jgi:hypothetical protein